jgi:tetratricopeptide (TPR) repeat protein
MADVFLSYTRAQRELTEALAHDIEAAGMSAWWDTSLLPADVAQDEIELQLAAAKAIVVLWNLSSVKSRWIWAAAEQAAQHQKLVNVYTPDLDTCQIPQPFDQGALINSEDRPAIIAALEKLGVERAKSPAMNSSSIPSKGSGLSGLAPLSGAALHHWQALNATASPVELREFLAAFSRARIAEVARARLSELEAAAWSKIPVPPTVEALEIFLADFPDSTHAAVATEERDRLKAAALRQAEEARQGREEEERRRKQAEELCAREAEMQRRQEEAERRRVQMQKEENRAAAEQADRRRHKEEEEQRRRLADEDTRLAEDEKEAFEEATREGTAGAYCKFLAMYPDGAHAGEARKVHTSAVLKGDTHHLTIINSEPLPDQSSPAPPIAPTMPATHQSRRKVLLATAGLGAAVVLVFMFSSYRNADAYMKRGDEYRANGRLYDAITEYTEAIKVYRESNRDGSNLALAYRKRAEVNLLLGSFSSAITDFSDAIGWDSRNDALFIGRGDAYRGKSEIDLAAADYTQALRLNSNNDRTLVKGVNDLRADNKRTEALLFCRINAIAFDRMARAEPFTERWNNDLKSTADAFGGISWRSALNREFPRALEAADRGIAITPKAVWMYTNRAHALMFLGRVDEARNLYRQYRFEKNVQSQKSWPTVVLEDFAEIRKVGLSHPLMDEIQRLFRNL